MPLWTASEHMPLKQKTASVTTKREILAGEHSDSTWAHLKVALQPMIPKALRKLGRSWTRPRKELLLTPTERTVYGKFHVFSGEAKPTAVLPQQMLDAAQIDNQQGEVPDFSMLGGGPLGLGGPPRSPGR